MNEKSKFDEMDPSKIIQEMRDEYWREITSPGEDVDEDRFQVLIARVRGEKYAFSAVMCKHIVKCGRITRVPRMPSFVLGVINLRGQIVSVIDMGMFLGLSPVPDSARARNVVVEVNGIRSAFKVDEVVGIEWVDNSRLREPQSIKSNIKTEYILGHIAPEQEEQGEWATFLDLEKIIQGPEMFMGRV